MSYIDWEYYNSLFNNVSDEKEFHRLSNRAEQKMNFITHMRTKLFLDEYSEESATDFQKMVYAQIKNTACELINAIHTQESSGLGDGIASVSNDGYSETYKITTAVEKEAQLISIVKNGLSGTGLAGAL